MALARGAHAMEDEPERMCARLQGLRGPEPPGGGAGTHTAPYLGERVKAEATALAVKRWPGVKRRDREGETKTEMGGGGERCSSLNRQEELSELGK